MAAAPTKPAWRRATLVLLLFLAGIAGAAASLLVGTAPKPPPPQAGELIINLPTTVWGLLFLSPILVGLTVFLLQRVTGGSASVRRWAALYACVVVLLFVAFVLLVALGGSGGGGTVGYSSSGKGTSPPQNNSSGGGTGGGSGGSGGPTKLYTLSLPSWSLAAFVLLLAVCAGALAIPGVISRLVDRPGRSPRPRLPDRGDLAAVMAAAAAAIERGEDPRATIVRLYGRLLQEVGPKVGDVAPLTADEIGGRMVTKLGVQAVASQTLTRLFEEARYSTHIMGTEAAGRCRDAIGLVVGDLRRPARAS